MNDGVVHVVVAEHHRFGGVQLQHLVEKAHVRFLYAGRLTQDAKATCHAALPSLNGGVFFRQRNMVEQEVVKWFAAKSSCFGSGYRAFVKCHAVLCKACATAVHKDELKQVSVLETKVVGVVAVHILVRFLFERGNVPLFQE